MKKQFDLYKVIIVASLLLSPFAGGWAYWLQGRITEGEAALKQAKSSRGPLQAIGLLQQEVDAMRAKSNNTQAEADPRTYFDVWVSRSSSGLKRNDYVINNLQDARVSDLKAVDRQWAIEFKEGGKTQLPLARELITFILHNIEGHSPAWRLRTLHLKNRETRELRGRGGKPPPEVADEWFVDRMVFAKREPDPAQAGRRGR